MIATDLGEDIDFVPKRKKKSHFVAGRCELCKQGWSGAYMRPDGKLIDWCRACQKTVTRR